MPPIIFGSVLALIVGLVFKLLSSTLVKELSMSSFNVSAVISSTSSISECVFTKRLNFDIIFDLDVTSPLRLPKDIQGAVRLLETENISNVITAAPARKSPYFNLVELGDAVVAFKIQSE